jgi:GntR family carbon starvation induced transcriptional regulator
MTSNSESSKQSNKRRRTLKVASSASDDGNQIPINVQTTLRLNEPDETSADGASITMQAYRRIRDDILFNNFKPDKKLKIDNLRDRYAFGLTPIREALNLLTSEGLVERFDQRGFRVAGATLEKFKDIHAMRHFLEERALRESIAAASVAWEEAIVLSHHRLSRVGGVRSEPDFLPSVEWEMLHRRFHMDLIANCSSPTLLRFCEQLYDLNIRYRYIAMPKTYPNRNLEDEHHAIMDAAISRNADKAVALLVEHYQRSAMILEECLARGH